MAAFDTASEVRWHAPAPPTMAAKVLHGLRRRPKELPSQFLYDQRGARLFERICRTPEYYLTRTELAILRGRLGEIAAAIGPEALLIEPGSGAADKARILLAGLVRPAGYVPVDLVCEQLARVAQIVRHEFRGLQVVPVCGDFTDLPGLPIERLAARRRVVFFPGSTIGNFKPAEAARLLRRMVFLAGEGAALLLGVDLRKSRRVLEAAYDDAAGVSREFALNYLVRLNGELGTDFDVAQFEYEAPYNAGLGRIEMALVSRRAQAVRLAGVPVRFAAGERVYTEYSYKYTRCGFAALAGQAGLRVERVWTDARGWFSVQLLAPR